MPRIYRYLIVIFEEGDEIRRQKAFRRFVPPLRLAGQGGHDGFRKINSELRHGISLPYHRSHSTIFYNAASVIKLSDGKELLAVVFLGKCHGITSAVNDIQNANSHILR